MNTITESDMQRLIALVENIDAVHWYNAALVADMCRAADRAVAIAGLHSDPLLADCVSNDMQLLKRAAGELAASVEEFSRLLGGVVDLAKALREQRDAALTELGARPSADQLYDTLVERIALANGCSLEAAARIAYILVSSDDDVLANDVVVGFKALQAFRDSVMQAESSLDQPS